MCRLRQARQTLAGISPLGVFRLNIAYRLYADRTQLDKWKVVHPEKLFSTFVSGQFPHLARPLTARRNKKWQYLNFIIQPNGADASLVSVFKEVVPGKWKLVMTSTLLTGHFKMSVFSDRHFFRGIVKKKPFSYLKNLLLTSFRKITGRPFARLYSAARLPGHRFRLTRLAY